MQDKAEARKLTSAQRYMLSLLNRDGELRLTRGFKVVRLNGASVGFDPSARALVARGLARYSDKHDRLLTTPAGHALFAEPENSDLETDECSVKLI